MTVRPDLLALTEDDLAAFASRGAVNRAGRELAGGALSCELSETAEGAITAAWSDGATVTLPAGMTVVEARCSCLAVGLCRHAVRTVLHYQRRQQAALAAAPWDPGAIPDEELVRVLPAAALERARALLAEGLLAELVRSTKPLARLHGLSCHVRFRVPGDLRYAAADCAPAAAPAMIAAAVWAFRRLPAERRAGYVVTGVAPVPPLAALDAVEEAARDWFVHGLAGAPPLFADALGRLARTCREAGLVWPAENLAEFAEEALRYAAHDALFCPERLVESAGELLARADAIRSGTGRVPALLVRGSTGERDTELGSSRLVGLGCSAVLRRGAVALVAHVQDQDTGALSVIARDFSAEAGAAEPRPFHRLAAMPVVQGTGLAQLARGQLVFNKARRTASGRLSFGRSRCTVSPQAYAWEGLREPALVEDLDELRDRLLALPPAALRPRRAGEDFHVLTVAGAEGARFDVARQRVVATLRGAGGRTASLVHPFMARAKDGCDAMLARLGDSRVRFVSGRVAMVHSELVVEPAAVVFEEDGRRQAVLPWIDSAEGAPGTAVSASEVTSRPPLPRHLEELRGALASLLVTGLRRADAGAARRLLGLAREGETLGLGRLPERFGRLGAELEARQRAARWDPGPAATMACELAVFLRMAQELT